jgi:hypothetical protein
MKYLTLTLLALTLLSAACGPQAAATAPPAQPTPGVIGGFPPVTRSPSPTDTEATPDVPSATQAASGPLLHWENDACNALESDGQNLSFGRCDGQLASAPASEVDLLRLQQWMALYAPFDISLLGSSAMDIKFNGQGTFQASDVEQRAIGEWASLRYDELESGRTGAAWGLVLDWNRVGGIAGFCDEVTVYLTGDYLVSNCKTASPTPAATPQPTLPPHLNTTQLEQLYNWYDNLKSFEYDYTDPAVSDAMTTRFTFVGQGDQAAADADIQAIIDFASSLLVQAAQEVSPQAAVEAQEALADELGIPGSQVTIVSVAWVEWPDSCLGVRTPGIMCAQVITPGYLILLEADGQQYEYHTDLTGANVVQAR